MMFLMGDRGDIYYVLEQEWYGALGAMRRVQLWFSDHDQVRALLML